MTDSERDAPPPSSTSSATRAEGAEQESFNDATEAPLKSTKSKGSIYPTKPSHFHLVFSHAVVTPEVLNHRYHGSGTEDDPFVVDFIKNDPRNPMTFSPVKKWGITILIAFATLAVSFVSSAYSGAVAQIIEEFKTTEEIATLGIALFVLGFAIGPLIWAPLSELYGRQILYVGTYAALTALNAGAAGSKNVQTLIVLRFLAGAFGSSPLTNAGGVIADMFPGRQRGVAMAIFASAPFMGPAIGPIVGGFVGETVGWRWLEGVMAVFTGVLWIMGSVLVPETYAPVLLSKRAINLSKRTGMVYKSRLEVGEDARNTSAGKALKTALGRPWVLLLKEPIVLLLTIYMAIIYGTLYMMFGAFPIVFQQSRGWSEGIGSLPFIGVAVGFIIAVFYVLFDNKRYERTEDAWIAKGEITAPPEARLPPCLIGSFCLPIGLFWFAWTNYPDIHWIVCIIATVPFGFGMLLVFTAIMNYLIDAYTIYAASVLAANSVLRSLFGFAFPLFTAQMYTNLGIHWASSIPAFLALMCVPFPFLFYKYGPAIRKRCKFAKEAMEVLQKIERSENPEEKDGNERSLATRNIEKEIEPEADKDTDLETGRATTTSHQDEEMSKVATKKSMRSMTGTKNATRSVRSQHSNPNLQLERARSYASKF